MCIHVQRRALIFHAPASKAYIGCVFHLPGSAELLSASVSLSSSSSCSGKCLFTGMEQVLEGAKCFMIVIVDSLVAVWYQALPFVSYLNWINVLLW